MALIESRLFPYKNYLNTLKESYARYRVEFMDIPKIRWHKEIKLSPGEKFEQFIKDFQLSFLDHLKQHFSTQDQPDKDRLSE